jgi:alpha-tubulin suppressor-like RCC1 family protein
LQGEVYTWGLNDRGQLGAQGGPHAGAWDAPRRMDLLYGWDVRAVACGAAHTVAITPQDVITWGANDAGQCGHGEKAEADWVKPRSLKLLHGQMVTQVVCGRYHTLCVTATSEVWAWGRNAAGQLGLGDTLDRRSPAWVDALWALPVLQLAAGESHSAALTSNGFLFTWGGNDRGQLGLPAAAEVAQQAAAARTASERRRVVRRVNQRFLQAMAEMGIPQDQAELALVETGNVGVEVATEWLFSVPADVLETHLSGGPATPCASLDAPGGGDEGGARVCAPRRVALQGVRAVAAGWAHTVAVTDEEVYAWGDNASGQLGLRSFRSASTPTEVAGVAGAGVCSVACGAAHTLFACRDGRVFGCGDAGAGALGELDDPDPAAALAEARWWRQALAEAEEDETEACDAAAAGPGSSPFGAGGGGGGRRRSIRFAASDGAASDGGDGDGPALRCVAAPTPLSLAFLGAHSGARAPVVTQVLAAAGSSAFLTRAADELPEPPPARLWERMQAAAEAARAAPPSEVESHVQAIAGAVEKVFGTAAAITAAFGVADEVGLEVTLLDSVQRAILELEPPGAANPGDPQPERCELHAAFRRAFDSLIHELERNVRLLGTPERAQVLLAAMQSPLLGDSRSAGALLPRLANIALAAPSSCRHLLVKWWADYPGDLLEARVVRPLQRYLTDELYATKKLTVHVMNAIKVLAAVEEANQLGRRLPPEAFYNELIR